MPIFKSPVERRSFWKRHVIACNESALSKASYCREHQLPYHQLIYWLSRCDAGKQPAVPCVKPEPAAKQSKKASRLLPVVLRDKQDAQGGIQITLPSGVMITGITEQHVSVALQLAEQL